jgi:hypothetical protein
MRFSSLFVLFSIMLAGTEAFACGDVSDCTAGFGMTESGSFYVRDFTPSYQGVPMVTMSSQDYVGIRKNKDGSITVYLSDGSVYIIKDIESLATHDLRTFEPKGLRNFLPSSRPSASYKFYYRSSLLSNNTSSDTVSPFGRTIYSGRTCTGTCKNLMGNVDSVAQLVDGSVAVAGWTCDRLLNKSLGVYVYAGDVNTGHRIAAGTANIKLSDSAKINKLCGGTTVGHRFRVVIPRSTVHPYRGQPIYVVGRSYGPNHYLPQSGKLVIPGPRVQGKIEGVSFGSPFRLRGWACEQGIKGGIYVRVYAGGPAGIGTYLTVGRASLSSGTYATAVGNACGLSTTSSYHRFDIPLTDAMIRLSRNKKFWLHAISTTNGLNYPLSNSGQIGPDLGIL